MAEKKQNTKRYDTLREILGLLIFVIALFVFLTLITHNAGDYGSIIYPQNEVIQNAGGIVGAFLSYYLYQIAGVGAFALPIFISFIGVILFINKEIKWLSVKLFATIIGLLSFSAILTLLIPNLPDTDFFKYSMNSVGGLWGLVIVHSIKTYLGTVGTFMSLFVLFAGSLLVASEMTAYYFGKRMAFYLYIGVIKFGKYFGIYFGKLMKQLWKGILFVGNKMDEKNVLKRTARAFGRGIALPFTTTYYVLVKLKTKFNPVPANSPISGNLNGPIAQMPMGQEKTDITKKENDEQNEKITPKQDETPKVARKPVQKELLTVNNNEQKSSPQNPNQTGSYTLPSCELLDKPQKKVALRKEDIEERKSIIEQTLANFKLGSKVVGYEEGPVLTKFELQLDPGVRVHKIVNVTDDLAIALKTPNVRIISPIPGKSTIAIEVPNAFTNIVTLRELIEEADSKPNEMKLPMFIGKNAAGQCIVEDLSEMPHLLIAGTTGAGKSVCINSSILSLLMNKTPDELKMILIDPKMVEMAAYRNLPHLMAPVVTEMKKAPLILEWLMQHMDQRYELLSKVGVKKIDTFNKLGTKKVIEKLEGSGYDGPVISHMPHIVVIVDELADLMMVAAKEVETTITRIAQKSRAVGIHMILATQRPSVDVITGLIKSNMPARIAFKVASKIDSRTILDRNGAERLLGKGDMLLLLPRDTNMVRAQCAYASEQEIKKIVDFLKKQAKPEFHEELDEKNLKSIADQAGGDELFDDAVNVVIESQRGSVSLLQRKLGIGYGRASRLIDMIAECGIVGPYKGSKAREVMFTPEEWEAQHAESEMATNTSS